MGFNAKVICTRVSVSERVMVSPGVWNSSRPSAGRERAAPSAQLAGEVPNNAKHVAVPFAVALWPYHVWTVPLIAYYMYEISNKMPSSFLWLQLSAPALLFPAALGTHTELKGSPYLCYPCGHMEVAARDKAEGDFPFLLGLRHKHWVCFALFFTLFFFFNEMHDERRKSKFNYKAVSSPALCLSGLGSAIISPLMQEWIQQHAFLNYYLFKMKGNYFQFSDSF